jgi:hypothetical protein
MMKVGNSEFHFLARTIATVAWGPIAVAALGEVSTTQVLEIPPGSPIPLAQPNGAIRVISMFANFSSTGASDKAGVRGGALSLQLGKPGLVTDVAVRPIQNQAIAQGNAAGNFGNWVAWNPKPGQADFVGSDVLAQLGFVAIAWQLALRLNLYNADAALAAAFAGNITIIEEDWVPIVVP